MLTEKEIREAQPKDKKYKLQDIENLFLIVFKTGTKTWKYRYQSDGKEREFTIGKWPAISRDEARRRALEYQDMRLHGLDPLADKIEKEAPHYTFRECAEEWLDVQLIKTVTPKYYQHVRSRLERFVYPAIGNHDIAAITDTDILNVLKAIQDQDKIQTMHNTKSACSRVFRYAKGLKRIGINPMSDMDAGVLRAKPRSKHFAAFIQEEDIRGLLRSFNHAKGHPWIIPALWFSIYTFARPGEVRKAEWSEFDEISRRGLSRAKK